MGRAYTAVGPRTEEFKRNRTTGDKESFSSKEYVELWWSYGDMSSTTEVFREHLTANIPTATLARAGSKQTSNRIAAFMVTMTGDVFITLSEDLIGLDMP